MNKVTKILSSMEEVYAAPTFTLNDRIVIYKAECPNCAVKLLSWHEDILLATLIAHSSQEHKSELLEMIKSVDNFDQVLLDMLSKPPVNFGYQVFRKYISKWAVSKNLWVEMPDVITTF